MASEAKLSASASGSDVRMNDDSTTSLAVEVDGHTFRLGQQPKSFNHGLTVWDASIAIAHYLSHNVKNYNPRKLRGKRGIDTGAGCGLSGLALARLGCDVVLTDLPDVLPQLKANASLNAATSSRAGSGKSEEEADAPGRVTVQELSWGDDVSHLDPPFDFVLASDVVYNKHLVDPLLQCMYDLSGPRTVCLVANELRDEQTHQYFVDRAPLYFKVKKIPRTKMGPDFAPDNIKLFELRKRRDGLGDLTAGRVTPPPAEPREETDDVPVTDSTEPAPATVPSSRAGDGDDDAPSSAP